MEYTIYKFKFPNGVHFGITSLESTQYTFQADTFFSALCIEARKQGEDCLEELVHYVETEQLLFSDAFPYIEEEYYLPKPMLHIENQSQGDSVVKKAYKNMDFVPLSVFEHYLNGTLPIERTHDLGRLGNFVNKVSVSIRGEEETKPYRVGIYYYQDGCGLYVLVCHKDTAVLEFFESLLEGLSFAGIGGKRNAGLGRFNYYKVKKIPEKLLARLNSESEKYMTLSVSLPTETELDKVMEQASYLLEKRSGFVYSPDYAQQQLRKKDLYVCQAGSCFGTKYKGAVYDVSAGGTHPAYRYAKPLFMEVSLCKEI